MNHNTLLFALGAILLGAVGICFHEFAMQWQPVPPGIGMRTQLAYLAGAVLVVGGALLLTPRLERAAALLLTVFIGLWMLVLNLPVAIASASHIGSWNSPAEIALHDGGSARAVCEWHQGQRAADDSARRATAGGRQRALSSASRISTTSTSPRPWCRHGFRTRRSGPGPPAPGTSPRVSRS